MILFYCVLGGAETECLVPTAAFVGYIRPYSHAGGGT